MKNTSNTKGQKPQAFHAQFAVEKLATLKATSLKAAARRLKARANVLSGLVWDDKGNLLSFTS